MSVEKRILAYAEKNFNCVYHTTLNPEGPGVVRIHLIPPAAEDGTVGSGVAIINGQDVIPVNTSWSILLAEFTGQVNLYSGHELSKEDTDAIMKKTVRAMRKIYPFIGAKLIKSNLYRMMNAFKDIARGAEPEEEVGLMSLGDYAPFMRAPHRMDLMVSAMTKDGCWHCNQKCVHCYAAGQELAEEKELSTDEWKQIIDKCRDALIPQLTFTGGEPTMRDDLPELIDYAAWFVTRLNTNGLKLTAEYCKRLKDVSLDSMQITFYSCDPKIHNTLVGGEHFDAVVSGIKNALSAGLNVSVNTPLCSLNKDYKKTLEFLHGLGVEYVTCSGLITTGNAACEASAAVQLSVEEVKSILRESVSYAYENGMEISFTSPGWLDQAFCEELGITMASCGACLSNMAVTPGGAVVPCQSWLSGKALGSILADSWDDIWNAPDCVIRRSYSAKMTGRCPLRKERF